MQEIKLRSVTIEASSDQKAFCWLFRHKLYWIFSKGLNRPNLDQWMKYAELSYVASTCFASRRILACNNESCGRSSERV